MLIAQLVNTQLDNKTTQLNNNANQIYCML